MRKNTRLLTPKAYDGCCPALIRQREFLQRDFLKAPAPRSPKGINMPQGHRTAQLDGSERADDSKMAKDTPRLGHASAICSAMLA